MDPRSIQHPSFLSVCANRTILALSCLHPLLPKSPYNSPQQVKSGCLHIVGGVYQSRLQITIIAYYCNSDGEGVCSLLIRPASCSPPKPMSHFLVSVRTFPDSREAVAHGFSPLRERIGGLQTGLRMLSKRSMRVFGAVLSVCLASAACKKNPQLVALPPSKSPKPLRLRPRRPCRNLSI
jgi:hypothetical protein